MKETQTESLGEVITRVTHDWWTRLQKTPGGRARLKRCGSMLELALEPEPHTLRRQLIATSDAHVDIDTAALIAGVLAWAERSCDEPPGEQLGNAAQKQSAVDSRFRRLLREDRSNREELLEQWRRMIALVKGEINPGELGRILFFWGERAKKDLATAFYEKSPSPQSDK